MNETIPIPEELLRVTEQPRACSYVPGETASLEYLIFRGLSPEQLECLLSRGWRRFGMHLFRPACSECRKCVPLRVDVQAFQPTKSQRKILRKNKNIRVELHEATVSDQHVSLYNQWHADMSERSGWKLQQTSIDDYAESFLFGGFSTLKELRYFLDGSLVGVGLIDLLPSAVSSVYFYHVPDWRPQSPGTFSMLCEIELAQSLHLNHLYLGYWIAECPSMAYKNRFSPSEVLEAWPGDQESPNWKLLAK